MAQTGYNRNCLCTLITQVYGSSPNSCAVCGRARSRCLTNGNPITLFLCQSLVIAPPAGILLSSVPGKVFGRIVNGRLQAYFERRNVFPDTQCGFRAGRGTTDMIFTLRMAMELARIKSHKEAA